MANLYIGDAKGIATWMQLLIDDAIVRLQRQMEKNAQDREIYEALKR